MVTTALATRTNGKYFWQEITNTDGDKVWGIWTEGVEPTQDNATAIYVDEDSAKTGVENQVHEDAVIEAERTGVPLYEVVEGVTERYNRITKTKTTEPAWFIARNDQFVRDQFSTFGHFSTREFSSVEDAEQGIEFLRDEEAKQKAADAEFPASMSRVEKLAKMVLKTYGSANIKKVAQALLDDAVKPAEAQIRTRVEGDDFFDTFESKERPKRKGEFTITLNVAATQLKTVEQAATKAFGDMLLSVEKVNFPKTRAERMDAAATTVSDALGEVESLRDDMQEAYDAMPENFQQAEAGQELEANISSLESAISSLEAAESEIQG